MALCRTAGTSRETSSSRTPAAGSSRSWRRLISSINCGRSRSCCSSGSREMAANASPAKAEPMLQFFAFGHLRADLQPVSRAFGDLAQEIVDTLPRNPERTVALRKLLEAKDCAVRALLY